jgi:hypothetical protein
MTSHLLPPQAVFADAQMTGWALVDDLVKVTVLWSLVEAELYV